MGWGIGKAARKINSDGRCRVRQGDDMSDLLDKVPPSFRISADAANDDWRHYEFTRNSRIPRDAFERDAMEIWLEWRWVAIGLLIAVLIAAALTGVVARPNW